MKQYFVMNPESKIYHIFATDEFEAIHKAMRIDSHIYPKNQYKAQLYK